MLISNTLIINKFGLSSAAILMNKNLHLQLKLHTYFCCVQFMVGKCAFILTHKCIFH